MQKKDKRNYMKKYYIRQYYSTNQQQPTHQREKKSYIQTQNNAKHKFQIT